MNCKSIHNCHNVSGQHFVNLLRGWALFTGFFQHLSHKLASIFAPLRRRSNTHRRRKARGVSLHRSASHRRLFSQPIKLNSLMDGTITPRLGFCFASGFDTCVRVCVALRHMVRHVHQSERGRKAGGPLVTSSLPVRDPVKQLMVWEADAGNEITIMTLIII